MKKLLIALVVMASMMSVLGCKNTADGVAEDTENAVDAVKDTTN
jgi:predicted small secreted protein